jgi:hypothetical protein
MNKRLASAAASSPGGRDSYVRLHGRWRLLARGGWSAVVIGALGICVASLPVYLAQLRTPCAGSACSFQQLTPAQVGALTTLGLSLDAYAAYTVAGALANIAVCLAVSAVIVLRRPEDRMALIVALMLATLGPISMSESLAASPSLWQAPHQYLSDLGVALLLLVFALFPTGRFAPAWMRWPVVVMTLTSVAPAALATLKLRGGVNLGFVVFLVEAALLVVVQLYRYRRVSSPLQRQQTKWIVFGFAALMTCWVIAFTPSLLLPALAQPGSLYLPVAIAVQDLTIPLIPLSFGVAMLRYRLWDIDALINRALVYGALTVILTALYAGLVIGLQTLSRGLIGQDNSIVIVLSTLLIAALVLPLRRWLQTIIDRQFYRSKYDATKALHAFSESLRHEVRAEALRERLLAVVNEAMRPAHVSLWLRPPVSEIETRNPPSQEGPHV